MAWVRSEYASEFAVLSAWLAMVLPWNVVYHTSVPTPLRDSEIAIVRLSIVEVQFRTPAVITIDGPPNATLDSTTRTVAPVLDELFAGSNVVSDVFVTTPVGAITHYDGYLQLGSVAWALGALALLSAFAVSLALYVREDATVARSPVDPVRLIGGLLGAATVAMAAASVLYFLERDVAGTPIPIGVVVMGALATALLRVERR